MSLRRLAQFNNAASATNSPRAGSNQSDPNSPISASGPASPGRFLPGATTTPRNRVSFVNSPSLSPSISASRPFDWEAVRGRKPPPYASPIQNARAKAQRKSEIGAANSKPRRVVRKKSLIERISSLPSQIIFEISLFPHNVPLPQPETSAKIIGGFIHLLHLSIRIYQIRKIPDDELNWEDLYSESRGSSWFDWTTLVTMLLILASISNAIRLFTRIKLYNLHHRKDLVNSPHASFVSANRDSSPLEPPPLSHRFRSWFFQQLSASWRFFFNLKQSPPKPSDIRYERVQQLTVWTPPETEMLLFIAYSPAHALLYMGTNSSNWILMFLLMGTISFQLSIMQQRYEGLVKDRRIISAEVMHEYNKNFVIPRMNPVRKDAAVMTHESEIVNVWED